MGAKEFLEWNKDEIYKGLLAVEGHFRYLRDKDFGCIIKHLAEVEGHCDEAISHTSELGLDPSPFRLIRDEVKNLRKNLDKVDYIEGIRKTRTLRRMFEILNQEFNVKCNVCRIDENRPRHYDKGSNSYKIAVSIAIAAGAGYLVYRGSPFAPILAGLALVVASL